MRGCRRRAQRAEKIWGSDIFWTCVTPVFVAGGHVRDTCVCAGRTQNLSRGCEGKEPTHVRTFGPRGGLGYWSHWAAANPPPLRDPGVHGAKRRREAPTHDLASAVSAREVVRPPEALSVTTNPQDPLNARALDCLHPLRRRLPLTDDRPLRLRRRLSREQGGDRAERGSTGTTAR